MKWLLWVGAAVVAFLLFGVAAKNSDPRSGERQVDRDTYELCLKEMKDELKSAQQRDLTRQLCERQRAQYLEKYGREP